tara:strand:+ start:248 stop:556 length:309 start_codon:yes stop_codon:yes gene_type:complete
MPFKMKGPSLYSSPITKKASPVSKDKSQTRNLYQGPITEEDQKRLDAGESKFDIFNEKDEAAWYEEQDGNKLEGKAKKKSRKKSDAMFNEAYIVRDRTKKKQ